MSNLSEYAREELERAGLFKEDSDYGGMIGKAVMDLIETHSKEGHSGMSHSVTIAVFNKVVNYLPLTPIGQSRDEWMEVGEDRLGKCWQNKRKSTLFSHDEGKTYYDIDDNKRRNWPNNPWYINLRNRFIK